MRDVLIVIQARMGSSRLPGKILKPIGKLSVLGHLWARVQETGWDAVVAVPTHTDLRQIAPVVPKGFIRVYPGVAEWDVLTRIAMAAWEQPYRKIIVRLTADCPMIPPAEIEAAVRAVYAGEPYASNVGKPRRSPDGWDVEAFTLDVLTQASELTRTPSTREHVTPYMRSQPFRDTWEGPDWGKWRLTVDTEHDVVRLREIAQRIDLTPPGPSYEEWAKVADLAHYEQPRR